MVLACYWTHGWWALAYGFVELAYAGCRRGFRARCA